MPFSLAQNIVAYIIRLVGDVVTVILGAVGLALFAVGIVQKPEWTPSTELKWGFVGVAFVIASYRLWTRTEHARTSDAVTVLVRDAEDLYYCYFRRIVEFFPWPPCIDDKPVVLVFHESNLAADTPVFRELTKLRSRIEGHAKLVRSTLEEHNIKVPDGFILDPKHLAATTALLSFQEYIERLKELAAPPASLFETWSKRRYRR